MKIKFLSLICLLTLVSTLQTLAQDALMLHYDFSQVTSAKVKDLSGSAADATLMSGAQVETMGRYSVLNLGIGNGYLSMPASAGKIFAGLQDYTVSVYYRVSATATLSGNGYFLWTFTNSPACGATSGAYSAYRLNAQRMASTTKGYQNEVGYSVGTATPKDRWIHVAFSQQGTTGKLYINGVLKSAIVGMPLNTDMFGSVSPNYCWIGRSPFSGDNYLRGTLVTDFRLYGTALPDDTIRSLAAKASALEHDYKYGIPGDFTVLGQTLSTCRALLAGSLADYAPNAIAELRDNVTLGEQEYAAHALAQSYIDARVSALNAALERVERSKTYVPLSETSFTVGTQGFRHPGGLHTDADFARIKQALADGDARITEAWQKLCNNEYAQSTIATWPVETIVRGGSAGQNYMNVARGAAMAYQNALRWKIGGTTANADAAVRILMAWARGNKYVSGDTNLSLAAGIYGYELAQAAELMRDYAGWSRDDFAEFKRYMMRTWYPAALDFLRRRHGTWENGAYPANGPRPGHYWSNWGLCNVLCLMSIGILCDDVHIYNQGVSFYKYDHVGTFKDRSANSVILNDGLNEFIGNLVPVVMPDSRGPLGFLGQMQESGRDQGHALMALGLAVDICQVGYNQGDDLFGYMDDRLVAGIEHVAALNFGGEVGSSLPWITYNYADCRTAMGAGWAQTAPNEGGIGNPRPYWDRVLGYYEGVRGIKMPYSEKAAAVIGIDMGGGNYGQTSGGFDHLGFSTLTASRPAIGADAAPAVLHGDMIYRGDTLRNQTNLGGLRYTYNFSTTKAIAADGADIVLCPRLPAQVHDNGRWLWSTGETSRQITVKADRSRIYRVTYTADNGATSEQAFTIAVAGDCQADLLTPTVTVDGTTVTDTTAHVLYGEPVTLAVANSTGWTNDYHWDNGATTSTVIVNAITTDRTYTCQYVNQGGAVGTIRFHLFVDAARQYVSTGSTEVSGSAVQVLEGTPVTLRLEIPESGDASAIAWPDGTTGETFSIAAVDRDRAITATYNGVAYTFRVSVKGNGWGYYKVLTTDKGYALVTSTDELTRLSPDHYFVLATDAADLLIGLRDAPLNGNKALFVETTADPKDDVSKLFTIEPYLDGYGLRHVIDDGLLLQTEYNRPDQLRLHDQPVGCEWTKLLLSYANGAWTVENGKYTGNWMGLWTPANGYVDGQELSADKTGDDVTKIQIFAIDKSRFHTDYLAGATPDDPREATPFVVNPAFSGANGYGWTLSGKWGNQRYNGAAEVWHSTGFDISQTISNLPDGTYTLTCQLCNGEGAMTGYLYGTSGGVRQQAAVSQSCAGSTFALERDKMAADSNYARVSVELAVTGGTLTMGIADPSAGTNWLVFDDFTLIYHGTNTTGIETLYRSTNTKLSDTVMYDLLGRRVSRPSKGIYIMNGRKIVVR